MPDITKSAEASLRAFSRQLLQWLLDGYSIDSADVQDAAVTHGLLKQVIVTEPCGESCTCAEVVDFPAECYRFSEIMNDAE